MGISDEDFKAYAEEVVANEARRKAPKEHYDFEPIQWLGLQKNDMVVFRVVGGLPFSLGDPTAHNTTKEQARLFNFSTVISDKNKMFRLILPPKNIQPDHLIWRIIDRVMEVEWVNKKKVFVHEFKNPEAFDIVRYNGLKSDNPRRKFEKGWAGQNVLLMNVIDRQRMEWHRANKHYMLLSKDVNDLGDDKVFAFVGVPYYGFYTAIATQLFKYYGNWNNYDIGVTRKGQMNSPYEIINATAFKEAKLPQLPESLYSQVSSSKTLTEEELSWEGYDLNKLFGVTRFSKLKDNLSIKIKKIDSILNTNFYDELMYEVDTEKKKFEAENPESSKESSIQEPIATSKIAPIPTPEFKESVKSATKTRGVKSEEATVAWSQYAPLMKGYGYLTEDQKKLIKDVIVKDNQIVKIEFDESVAKSDLEKCPQCNIATPSSFDEGCVVCGISWGFS